MPNADQLIKLGGLLVQLRSDAAYKPISKWRHSAENNSRPVLYDSVSLRQGRQDDVSLLHCHLHQPACIRVQTQSGQGRVLSTRTPHAACSASSTEVAANFPSHLLKMASSEGDKGFTSASSS